MDNTQTATPAPEHHGHAHATHSEPDFKLYIIIFVGLCVLTLVSFLSNQIVNHAMEQPMASTIIIMLVSVAKATLVAMFFMHLKWDWSKLYFLVVPVVIMGVMMIIVFLPDILLAWHH